MKPWEETWVDNGAVGGGITDDAGKFVADFGDDGERQRFAAQAPAMARLLLAMFEHERDGKDWSRGHAARRAEDILRAAGVLP